MLWVMAMQEIKLTRFPSPSFNMHLVFMKCQNASRNCMDDFTHIWKSLKFDNHPHMSKIRLIRLC